MVDALAGHQGRKTLVLFSEGLSLGASTEQSIIVPRSPHMDESWLTDNRFDHFTRLVERANAARVAFYTFDAAGLRVHGAPVGFGEAAYVGLKFLADETGGRFVENTNDLGPGLVAMAADLENYYLMSYVPSKPPENGGYREIDVGEQSGVKVYARRATARPADADVRRFHHDGSVPTRF